jgi:signal transduction histidine kinase
MDSLSRSIKILIIAEEQGDRSILTKDLHIAHYDVITAQNEEEGLKLATTTQPDLILLDWRLSRLGCFTLFEQLKSDPTTRSIPVILLTDKENVPILQGGLEPRPVDYLLRPYKLEELHACIRKVLVGRDERHRLRLEIQQVKCNLATLLAHELRFPITIFSGFAELMNQETSCGESSDRIEYLQQIKRQADNLKDLMEDFNYLLHCEQIVEDVDLIRIVQAAVERYRKQIEEKNQRIILKFPEGTRLVVQGKSHNLFMALRHLISNAYKFTQMGGTITVTITSIHNHVRIEVADTGIGIPKSQQRFISDIFYQGQQTVTPASRGMGLGLTIARSVAEQHHGSFGFESRTGLGSRFWIDLPLNQHDNCLA